MSQKIIRKNLKLLEKIRFDYAPMITEYNDIFEPLQQRDESQTNTITYHINNDTGKMEIDGSRYIRLGKVKLYDSLENKSLSPKKHIVILDTETQILHCFDIARLYDEYILTEKNHVFTKHNTFNLSESTKSIVLGEMF